MEDLPKITLESFYHKDKNIICLKFDYNKELHLLIKQMKGRMWTNTHRSWYVESKPGIMDELSSFFAGKALLNCFALKENEIKGAGFLQTRKNDLPVLDEDKKQE